MSYAMSTLKDDGNLTGRESFRPFKLLCNRFQKTQSYFNLFRWPWGFVTPFDHCVHSNVFCFRIPYNPVRNDRGFQSIVVNSAQKMALRALYSSICQTYYEVKLFQRHLLYKITISLFCKLIDSSHFGNWINASFRFLFSVKLPHYPRHPWKLPLSKIVTQALLKMGFPPIYAPDRHYPCSSFRIISHKIDWISLYGQHIIPQRETLCSEGR